MKSGRRLKKPEKINLVPILDAVFIFIFFLLMSAQFVDVYEIGSSLPMTREATKDKDDKDPLNLTLVISKEQVVVNSGLKNPVSRTFASIDEPKLKEYLVELKTAHPKENTIILKADRDVPFQRLVAVIDTTQKSKDSKEKIFEQIVFDNAGVNK